MIQMLSRLSCCISKRAVLLALILAVAAILRLFALGRIPPGLYYDEAANAVDALNTLRSGNWPAFYDTQGGKEALWMWLLAAVFWVAGMGILQIRLLAALVGLLTVGAVGFAARELFSADEDSDAWELALLSAAVLATLFAHVHFSRDGYRLLTQPLVGSLALGALWRGMGKRSWRWFVLGGALLGLAMYTYSAARFYVVLLVAFFMMEWPLARLRSASLLSLHWRSLIGMALTATIVFIPMGLHLVTDPSLITHRASEVSIFDATWNQGRFGAALFDSIWRNFAGLVWQGTMNSQWNIPGRPLLDGLAAAFFLLGIGFAVRRWQQPVYLFLLLWLIILYLPAVLSYDRVPTFHRSQGATPAVVMLVAVGVQTAWRWIAHRLSNVVPTKDVTVPLMAVLLVSGTVTARDYFLRWGPSWDAYLATQPYYLQLVEQMNQEPEASAVYLFSYDLRNGEYEHPDLQLFYHGSSPYVSISDHEGKMLAELTEAVAGREVVRLVHWKVGRSSEADPKQLISALLTMYGKPLGVTAETPAYRIKSFRLSAPDIDFRSMPPLWSEEVPLDNGLELRAFSFGATDQATLVSGNPLVEGQHGWVLLVWRAKGLMSVDYKASVRLVDGNTVLAQQDKYLFNGFHLGTADWQVGEEVYDLYILPLPRAGQYQLQVVIYDPTTLSELLPGGLVLPESVEVVP